MEDLDPFSIWSRCQLSRGGVGQLHNSPLYHKTNTESPEQWRETWRHGGNTERPEAWESNPWSSHCGANHSAPNHRTFVTSCIFMTLWEWILMHKTSLLQACAELSLLVPEVAEGDCMDSELQPPLTSIWFVNVHNCGRRTVSMYWRRQRFTCTNFVDTRIRRAWNEQTERANDVILHHHNFT